MRSQTEFLRFLLTGGVAALVNFLSRLVLNQWFGFSVAVFLAYLIGMGTAYILARQFVFTSSTRPLVHSVLWFTAVNLLAVLQTWGVSMALYVWVLPKLGVTEGAPEIAHAMGILVPVVSSFYGHKYLSFGGSAR